MEDNQKDNVINENSDSAVSEIISETIDAAKVVESTVQTAACDLAVNSSKGSGSKALIAIIVLLIISIIGTGFSIYTSLQNKSKTDGVIAYIGAQSGKDLNALLESGHVIGEGHPLYDDKAVVEAYKTGDASKLSEKDSYVYKTAKDAIDQVIKDGMSDYEKELAIYNWLFHRTHYNNTAFVDVETMTNKPNASPAAAATAKRTSNMSHNAEGETEDLVSEDKIASSDPFGEGYDYEPYGVLKFKNAICVGNATTFKLFMDMLDIPCKIIHSTEEGEHAWNLVKIGGDWYHVDLTFDYGEADPAYSNFNVTDNVKFGSYPWDTTEFPAANATKYSYIAQNAIEVDNVYEIPAIVRKALDEKKIYLYLKPKDPKNFSSSAIDDVMLYLQNRYEEGSFYSTPINLTEDETFYQLQLLASVNEIEDDSNGSESDIQIDQERFDEAMDAAFENFTIK